MCAPGKPISDTGQRLKKSLRGLEKSWEKLLRSEHRYAVRSSADVEDSVAHSFAGQFDTRLNVARSRPGLAGHYGNLGLGA